MKTTKWVALIALAVAVVIGPARAYAEDQQHISGTITTRLASGFIMQTYEGTPVTVAINEGTKLKVDNGKGHWEASELVPGLRVKCEGAYDASMTFVAHEIKFSAADRKLAQAIKAGLTPTDAQVAKNVAALERHGATLDEHGQTIATQGRELNDHENRIVATTGAIATTNERIGRLDDYNVIESFTVYFANGQARVPKKYLPQLQEFVNKAKGVKGYMLAIEGHASAPGDAARNTTLSHLRAEAVTSVLQQEGVPMTNIFVPAAMGETNQVTDNKTRAAQAANRRVVVTILQNKGVAQK